MEQKFLKTEQRSVRVQALKDNAEKTEEFTYPKALGADDLSFLKDNLVKDSVSLSKLEEERKEFLTQLKSKVKPLKQEVAVTLGKLRTKVEEVTEVVYLLADQEEGMMGYYNADGNLVYQRVLLAEERQFRIVDASSNGTNN